MNDEEWNAEEVEEERKLQTTQRLLAFATKLRNQGFNAEYVKNVSTTNEEVYVSLEGLTAHFIPLRPIYGYEMYAARIERMDGAYSQIRGAFSLSEYDVFYFLDMLRVARAVGYTARAREEHP